MSNDILIFDNGKVNIAYDGLDIPEIKEFYDGDKKPGKPKFGAYMKALYYIHSKSSPYANMDIEERVNRVNERHIGMRKWSNMVQDEQFRKIVDLYIDIVTTKEERQYERQFNKILQDIDNTIDNLQKVSMKKKGKFETDVTDPTTGLVSRQTVEVEVLHMAERLEVQKALKSMFEFRDYIKERMKKKDIMVQKKKYVPLFDNPTI